MNGATIERGKVLSVQEEGYKIQSFTRDGLITPVIKPLITTDIYEIDDLVYFFLFNDGHGAVIARVE